MKALLLFVTGIVLFASTGIPIQAHHSNVTFFFMDQTKEISGVVKELRIVNPHGRLLIEVTDQGGQKAMWTVDTPNAVGMRERGWTVKSLVPGEVVRVIGRPARNPAARGMYGVRAIKADGSVLTFGAAN